MEQCPKISCRVKYEHSASSELRKPQRYRLAILEQQMHLSKQFLDWLSLSDNPVGTPLYRF